MAGKKKTRKKKTAKKATKKSAKKPKKSRENTFFLLGLLALVILLIIVSLYTYMPKDTTTVPSENTVLVTVNGKQITQNALDFQYDLLPPSYKAAASKEVVLEQIVDEELIVQAAQEAGFTVSQEDVHEQVQGIIAGNGVTPEELAENLDQFGVTMEQFEGLIERQLLIQAYLDDVITVGETSEADIKNIYDASPERFTIAEQAKVRHILVSTQREDAAIIAKDAYDRAQAGDDFCDLVKETTDDRGSRETCGEYTFPRGMMVPKFEEASFAMDIGEFRMIQTEFGYHVIEKLEDIAAGMQPFDEVQTQIKNDFENSEFLRQRQALVSGLRDEATITYDAVVPKETPEPEAAPVVSDEDVLAEAPVEEAVEAPPVVEPSTEPVEVMPAKNDDPTLNCIAKKVTLYGASWNQDTQDALGKFEGVDLPYIACDEKGSSCFEREISAYPTWMIDGERYLGPQSVEVLAQLTEC
ncbi:MAG: peptidylprolyl isomerase [Candidatus Woesearchaeota archaeon]|nr:peptidylprolyl isomerase [Candidatus Woesearchaeota archaeon]